MIDRLAIVKRAELIHKLMLEDNRKYMIKELVLLLPDLTKYQASQALQRLCHEGKVKRIVEYVFVNGAWASAYYSIDDEPYKYEKYVRPSKQVQELKMDWADPKLAAMFGYTTFTPPKGKEYYEEFFEGKNLSGTGITCKPVLTGIQSSMGVAYGI